MSGYVGDLSEDQGKALKEFQEQLPKDHGADDHELLRFLRAREFNVNQAFEMYNNYLDWRTKENIDQILNTQPPKADLYAQFVPFSHHGFDKEGRPILFEKTGLVDWPTMTSFLTDEDLMANHTWEMEQQVARAKESSRRLNKNVESFTRVVDLAGLNMTARKGVKFIRMCASQDQNYYPERLGKVFLINTPSAFPFFWKICKRWLNNHTRSKIEVLGKDYKQTLLKFIDPEHIPVEYGGTCSGVCRAGKGKCLPVTDISSYKKQLKYKGGDSEFDSIHHSDLAVPSRKHVELRLAAGETGAKFEWNFHLNSGDLVFSVDVLESTTAQRSPAVTESKVREEMAVLSIRSESKSNVNDRKVMEVKDKSADLSVSLNAGPAAPVQASEGLKKTELVKAGRVKQAKGSYTSRIPGATLIIRFDNSEAKLTGKKLRYHVSAEEPFEEEELASSADDESDNVLAATASITA